MTKRLFLLFCLCLTGSILHPGILAASHDFAPKMPNFDTINTIIWQKEQEIAQKEAEETEKAEINLKNAKNSAEISQSAEFQASSSLRTPVASVPITSAPINYTVTRTISSTAEYSATYANLSYGDIYRFRKLIYGHNSSNLLGSLAYRTPGEIFTITDGGSITSYQVTAVSIYDKTDNSLNNDKSLMGRIATSALGYDIALMTCAGTPLGGGDATQRLVVYANRI